MDQKSNDYVAEECGEQNKTGQEKGNAPTKQDLDQLGENINTVVVQKEMENSSVAGKEDVGDREGGIAELCLPQDTIIPEAMPFCDTEKMEVAEPCANVVLDRTYGDDTGNKDRTDTLQTDPDIDQDEMESDNPPRKEALGDPGQTPKIQEGIAELYPCLDDSTPEDNHHLLDQREQEKVSKNHPMEVQDKISGSRSTKDTLGAPPKEKCEDLKVLEQHQKISYMPEDIAELCLNQECKPSLQDDIIEEEQLPRSLSSADDGVTPRPPPDDEGGNIKQLIEMGACRPREMSRGNEEEEVFSQPMSLTSNDFFDNPRIYKRSIQTEVQNFKLKKSDKIFFNTELESLKHEFLEYCIKTDQKCQSMAHEIMNLKEKLTTRDKETESLIEYCLQSDQERQLMKNEMTDQKKKYSKLLEAYRKQCVRNLRNNMKNAEERQFMKKDIADLKAARLPLSDSGEAAGLSEVEE